MRPMCRVHYVLSYCRLLRARFSSQIPPPLRHNGHRDRQVAVAKTKKSTEPSPSHKYHHCKVLQYQTPDCRYRCQRYLQQQHQQYQQQHRQKSITITAGERFHSAPHRRKYKTTGRIPKLSSHNMKSLLSTIFFMLSSHGLHYSFFFPRFSNEP